MTAKKPATKKTPKKTVPKKPAPKKTVPKKTTKKTVKKATPKKTKVLCISHKEDADGISSAALVRQAFGGDSILVDYPGQMEALRDAADDEKLKSLFVCDLGLSKKTQDEFISLMSTLRKNKVTVTYIDHHDIDPKVIKSLKRIKVKIIHDVGECTAVHVYNTFKSKLDDHATFVAACAAISDYMEDRPIGEKLLRMYDRDLAMINSTMLTYNIKGRQKNPDFLLELVKHLADSKFPHDLPDFFAYAQLQAAKNAEMIPKVKKGMTVLKNLAHMEVLDSGAGAAVNCVLGLSGKDVGVAYKERVDYGNYAISVRGSADCKVHLGKIVNSLSADLGGSGGGHGRACGAVVPKPKMRQFITELNKKIG